MDSMLALSTVDHGFKSRQVNLKTIKLVFPFFLSINSKDWLAEKRGMLV